MYLQLSRLQTRLFHTGITMLANPFTVKNATHTRVFYTGITMLANPFTVLFIASLYPPPNTCTHINY